RLMALLIVGAVSFCAWQAWGSRLRRMTLFWLMLMVVQAGLGVATVLSNKAADLATAHVLAGALSLATGAVLCPILLRNTAPIRPSTVSSRTSVEAQNSHPAVAKAAVS